MQNASVMRIVSGYTTRAAVYKNLVSAAGTWIRTSCNTRSVRVLLASQHPLKHVFLHAAQALAP